jgi:hypothetical protein
MGAIVGGALSNDYSLDGSVTFRARQSRSTVNAEVVLKVSPSIHPIDAGPLALDTFLQHSPDAAQ